VKLTLPPLRRPAAGPSNTIRSGLRAWWWARLEPEHKAERRGNHCQRERSNQDEVRPRSICSVNSGANHDRAGALAVEIGLNQGCCEACMSAIDPAAMTLRS